MTATPTRTTAAPTPTSTLFIRDPPGELQWWSDHVANVEREAHRAVAQAMAKEQAASQRLEQANAALLEAEQRLARVPVLEHQLREHAQDNAVLRSRLTALEGSITWRLTAPLRRLMRPFKR